MDYNRSASYLIHELAQHITAESDQILLERFGVGFSQYKVLLALQDKPGISQKHIAHFLHQTEASISRQIGILIEKNLAVIGPAKDNRRHLIYLMPRGEEMVRKATSALNKYKSPILTSLDEKQQHTLTELLEAVRSKIV